MRRDVISQRGKRRGKRRKRDRDKRFFVFRQHENYERVETGYNPETRSLRISAAGLMELTSPTPVPVEAEEEGRYKIKYVEERHERVIESRKKKRTSPSSDLIQIRSISFLTFLHNCIFPPPSLVPDSSPVDPFWPSHRVPDLIPLQSSIRFFSTFSPDYQFFLRVRPERLG